MTTEPTFTTDYVSGPIASGPGSWLLHVVPRLSKVPKIRWLEIGSWEGRSALWTAENVLHGDEDRIVCVDPWPVGYSDAAEVLFDKNTKNDRRIVKMKGASDDVLPLLRDCSFHGAYVDGLHREEAVLRDACEVARLLRPGGIIVFDDYANDDRDKTPDWGVQPAVDTFVVGMGSNLEVLFKGWQLIAQLRGNLA